MRKIFQCTLFGIGGFFLAACEKQNSGRDPAYAPSHVVSGQVFVIQKNRLNVKLGGVDVFYIPKTEFRNRCKWIETQRNRAVEVSRYKQKMSSIEGWLSEASSADSASKFGIFLRGADQLISTARSQFRANPEVVEFERIEGLRNGNAEFFQSSGISDNETCQWIATCLYFDWLDRASDRESKTDADGNFTITVPKSAPGVLMMSSSRQLTGGGFENYYWLKEIDGNEVDPLVFSSKDTVTGGFLMEIVRQASEPARSSQESIQTELGLVDLGWFQQAQTIFTTIATGDNQIAQLETQIRDLERTIQEIRYAAEP